jgi:hypothetical protein
LAQAALGPLFRCGWLEPHRDLGWDDHSVSALAIYRNRAWRRRKRGEKGDRFERFDACQIGEYWSVLEEGKERVVVGDLRSVEEKGEERERTKILQG